MATTPIATPANDPSVAPPAAPQPAAPPAPTWEAPPEYDPSLFEPPPSEPYTSKYRTRDETERGIAEQDRYIAQLRQDLARFQQAPAPTAQPATNQSFYAALDSAVQQKNPAIFDNAIAKALQEQAKATAQQELRQAFGAMAPVVGYANFGRAVEIASNSHPQGDPNIAAFVRSPQFKEMVRTWPTLSNGIELAKYDPSYAEQQLPEMLVLAYRVAGGATAPAAQGAQRTLPHTTSPPQTVGGNPAQGSQSILDVPFDSIDWTKT